MIKVTKTDLREKQNELVSGINIKTLNGETLLGTGNISLSVATPPVLTASYVTALATILLPIANVEAASKTYSVFGEQITTIGKCSVKAGAFVSGFPNGVAGTTSSNLGNISTIDNVIITSNTMTSLIANSLEAIEGDLTISTVSTPLTTISFPQLKIITGLINCQSSVPSISFPELIAITSFRLITGTTNLLTPKLKYISGSCVITTTATFDSSVLEETGSFEDSSSSAVNRVFPVLKRINSILTYSGTSLKFQAPLLETVLGAWTVSSGSGSTVSFPSLKIAGAGFTFNGNGLTTALFPALVRVLGPIVFNSGHNIVDVTFGTIGITKRMSDITFISGSLNQASIDGILALLVSLNGTDGTTLWGAGRLFYAVSNSSAPSAAGLINKNILIARGATVITY